MRLIQKPFGVLLLVAVLVCLSTAFKLRTETSQGTACNVNDEWIYQLPSTFSTDPATGVHNDAYLWVLSYHALFTLKQWAKQFSFNFPTSTMLTTSNGKISISDNGNQGFYQYIPAGSTSPQWMVSVNTYNPYSGVLYANGKSIYFDAKGNQTDWIGCWMWLTLS